MTASVSASLPSGPHMWPELRIIAGIDGVDDDVARDVEVGDPPVRVDHGERADRRRARRRRTPGSPSPSGSSSSPAKIAARPSLGLELGGGQHVAVAGEGRRGRTLAPTWPKMIGSETFIMVAFRCTREEHVLGLGPRDLVGEEGSKGRHPHDRCVDDLTGLDRHGLAQHGDRAVAADQLDAERAVDGIRPRSARSSGSRRPPCARPVSSTRATTRPSSAGGLLA